jgi:phosphatidylglycerol:prolipoprotein diacylglycerol transferase
MCYPRRVSHPLIPYIDGAKLDVPLSFLNYLPIIKDRIDPQHPPTIHMFAALVLFATAVGFSVVLERAADRKLDRTIFLECVGSSVLAGFIVAHVFDAVFYHPHLVRADPWYVLRIWDGLSSYGGFIGAISGMYAWGWYRGRPILEYCDLCCSSFPMAWVFGRMGCTLVHDHPGALSNAWYAVRYPADQLVAPYQGRIDLGLVELVLTIPLAFACHWLWRRKPRRPVGFYIGVTLTIYAPIRFLLDFLRIEPTDVSITTEADPRYLHLTPAQWASFVALAAGLYHLVKTYGAKYEMMAVPAGAGQAWVEIGFAIRRMVGLDPPAKKKKKKSRPNRSGTP